MSKIIYYLGAGASYGKREVENEGTFDEEKVIKEGLPIVAEIPERMQNFKDYIESAEIDVTQEYIFKNTYRI